MSSVSSSSPSASAADDCSICLNTLAPGTTLLTLSCNHKFHLQCLAANVKAHNNQCPLCRTALDASLIQMLASAGGANTPVTIQAPVVPPPVITVSYILRSALYLTLKKWSSTEHLFFPRECKRTGT